MSEYMACNECDTVMIRAGETWKCLNCGGTAGTLTADDPERDRKKIILRIEHALKQSKAARVDDVPREVMLWLLATNAEAPTLHASLAAAERERDELREALKTIRDTEPDNEMGLDWNVNFYIDTASRALEAK